MQTSEVTLSWTMGEGRAICAEEAALNCLWKQWPDIQIQKIIFTKQQ